MKYINCPIVILCAFLIRLLVTGASIGDSFVMLSLAALYGAYIYIEAKKPTPVNKEILERIIYLEEQYTKQRDAINSLKLGTLKR